MAVSSLLKLSVPLGSSLGDGSEGLLMPKLQYRFRVSFENFGITKPTTELTKQVMDITRPNVTFENMEIPVYNSKVYLAGKHTWNPITVNLREDVNGNVQRLVGEQLQRQFDFMNQSSAASGIDYKFVTRIEILDGGNGEAAGGVQTLETFELYGCFIQNANYNTLAYATNEPVTITLAIRYDNAVQFGADNKQVGIGTDVGRTIGTLITGGGNPG